MVTFHCHVSFGGGNIYSKLCEKSPGESYWLHTTLEFEFGVVDLDLVKIWQLESRDFVYCCHGLETMTSGKGLG